MPPPDPDQRARGFHLARVSNAAMWSDSARRLTHGSNPADAQLGFVALFMCVDVACKLVTGTAAVPRDEAAAFDCPVHPRVLRKTRDKLRGFRAEVLHLHDDEGREHREVSVAWQADKEPNFAMHYVDEGDEPRTLTIEEVDELLDKLDPWLRMHHARLLAEERHGPSSGR